VNHTTRGNTRSLSSGGVEVEGLVEAEVYARLGYNSCHHTLLWHAGRLCNHCCLANYCLLDS